MGGSTAYMRYRNLGLLTKINILVAIILLIFFGLSTYLNYRQLYSFTVQEATEKARQAASHAIRTREYLSQQYHLTGVQLSKDRYGLIPVVASNRIGQRVAGDLDYRIRQTSDRYRNPDNAPDEFEVQVLKKFRQEPVLEEYYEVTSKQGETVFRYLQPFRVEKSCLECHGDPEEAPEFIKQLFPQQTDQAYNYELGEIIGAASISIPMNRLEDQIYANLRTDLLTTGGIFIALITCLGLLIRIAVTRPLTRLGAGIQQIVATGRFDRKIRRRGRDEIGLLIDGFNTMMDHLREKTDHLEESEKRFRLLTENARDAIVSFLANGQVILFNREAERIFGYSKTEALGMTIERLVHEECESLHGTATETYLEDKGNELLKEVRKVPARRRDGSRVDLELSLSVAESDGHLFYTAILRE